MNRSRALCTNVAPPSTAASSLEPPVASVLDTWPHLEPGRPLSAEGEECSGAPRAVRARWILVNSEGGSFIGVEAVDLAELRGSGLLRLLILLFCRAAGFFFFLSAANKLWGVRASGTSTDAAARALLLALRTTSARELGMEVFSVSSDTLEAATFCLPPASTPLRTLRLFCALSAIFANVERCCADFFASGRGILEERVDEPAKAHHLSSSRVNRVSLQYNTNLILMQRFRDRHMPTGQ